MADKTVKLSLDVGDVKSSAREAQSSLDGVSSKLKAIGSQSTVVKVKVQATGIDAVRNEIGQLKTALGALGAVALFSKLAGFGKDLIEGAAGLLYSGAAFAVHAVDFKNETTGAMAKILGSSAAAAKLYEKIQDSAAASGMSQENAMKRSMALLNSGFKFSQIAPLVKLFADIEKIKGEGGSAPLSKIFEKVNASGKFDAKSISALAKQGVSTAAIYDELARQMGKSRKEVEAMFHAVDDGQKRAKGQKAPKPQGVSADAGIKAAMAVIQNRIGGVAAADSIQDLGNAWDIMKRKMFEKVNTGPMNEAIQSLLKAMGGKEGKSMASSIAGMFSQLFKTIFEPFKGPDGQKKIENMMRGISNLAKSVTGAFKELGPSFKWVVTQFSDLGKETKAGQLTGIQKMVATIKMLVQAFQVLQGKGSMVELLKTMDEISGKKTGAATKAAAELFDKLRPSDAAAKAAAKLPSVADPGAAATSALGGVGDSATAAAAAGASGVGTEMANGIKEGIAGGRAGIVSALVSACQAAVTGAKSALQINSPSRVSFGIGANTALGMAQGIAANSNGVTSAARAMAMGAQAGANSNAFRATGTGGAGGGSGVSNMAGGAGAGTTIHLTTNYHPPQVSVPGGNPADTAAHTEAASTASMASFSGHLTDTLRRLQDT